jgi:DNA-binding NarL/FixJ family response regulator
MFVTEKKIKNSFKKMKEEIESIHKRIEILEFENKSLKNKLVLQKNEELIKPKIEGLVDPTLNEVAKIKQKLTKAEQEIVMCLVESSEALTYKQIANKLEKSSATKKGHIVNMINKGLPIDSIITLHNQKAYKIKLGFERKIALTANRF